MHAAHRWIPLAASLLLWALPFANLAARTTQAKSELETLASNSYPGLEMFELESKATGRSYVIMVGLPDGYERRKAQTYPVVYLTDAEGKVHGATETSRGLAASGDLERVIVVGVVNPEIGSRRHDFTPAPNDTAVTATAMRGPLARGAGGGAADFHGFLVTELIPVIERNYRTDESTRVYFGASLGGLFGLYALQQKDDPFSHYLIVSPSVWWNDRQIFKTAIPSKERKEVYVSVGELEQIPPTLPEDIMRLFPDDVVRADAAARMVEGALEAFDYVKSHENVDAFAHVEEGAVHTAVSRVAYSRGIRVLLQGNNRGELRRRSAIRPELPWEAEDYPYK